MCRIGRSNYKIREKKIYEINSLDLFCNSRFGGLFPSPPTSGLQLTASPESDRGHSQAAASSSGGHGLPPQPEPIKQFGIKTRFILSGGPFPGNGKIQNCLFYL